MLQEGVRAVAPILLAVLLGGLAFYQGKLWPARVPRLQVPISADIEAVESCVASNGPQVVPGLRFYSGQPETYQKMPVTSPLGATYLSADGSFKLSLGTGRSGNEMVVTSVSALTNEQSALFRRCATSPLKVR